MFRQRFVILLVTLLLYLASAPILGFPLVPRIVARFLSTFVFFGVIAGSIYAVTTRRGHHLVAWFLAAAIVTFNFSSNFFPDQPRTSILTLSHLAGVLLLSFCVCLILAHIFRTQKVTTDTIAASLCVYLLLGVIWSGIYSAVDHFSSRAFSTELSLEGHSLDSVYFSLVTLTTLGYGDISPVSGFARMLTALEAVIGQIYLTVLVARLVGMHISQSLSRDEEK